MSQHMWQQTIETADDLVTLYRHLRDKHPEQHNFYQQQIAIAMFNKQYAIIKLRSYQKTLEELETREEQTV